jgi:hypothetical protein
MIVKVLQRLVAAGVVDIICTMGISVKFNYKFFDFNISYSAASAEVDLFLRDDLKDLRPFLLKRFLLFKSTTPAGK